jgi:hypothetical protein
MTQPAHPRPRRSTDRILEATTLALALAGAFGCGDGASTNPADDAAVALDSAGETDVRGTDVADATEEQPLDAVGSTADTAAEDTAGGDTTPNDSGAPDSGSIGADVAEIDGGADAESCAPTYAEVVTLTTVDGVALEGDLYTTGKPSGAAVVLLHMIPPFNNRKGYPKEFIDALLAQGLSVLNIDRRGAGGSGGVAEDAYLGPLGKWDPRAAVELLTALPCAPHPDRIGVVGASNGSTSAYDFAAWAWSAENDAAVAKPHALVFLSGGQYTENQTPIDPAQQPWAAALPFAFHYPPVEAEWNQALQRGAPATWSFEQHTPGAHGTLLFGSNPEISAKVAEFLASALAE